ncbi:MAG: hypothetical protein JSS61_04765 [Verrucomicrobia bacterium]|nr:hypothetical protein [Verrucomicrobiota bacterium]
MKGKTALLALGLMVGVGIFLLPQILSTDWGKKEIARQIGKRTSCQVSMESLSLSWMGPQSIQGLKATREQDALRLACPEITTDASLYGLIFQKRVGHLKIASPSLEMSKALTRLSSANRGPAFSRAGMLPILGFGGLSYSLPLQGQVIVSEGKVALTPSGVSPIAFDGISLLLNLSEEEAKFQLMASTSQGAMRGKVEIDGSATKNAGKADVTLTDLPVQGVDQCLSLLKPEWSGLFVDLLGDKLSSSSSCQWNAEAFSLNLSARSPLLSAQLEVATQGENVSLQKPGTLSLMASPSLLKRFSLPADQPLSLQIDVAKFSSPWKDFKEATSDLTLLFSGGDPIGKGNLRIQTAKDKWQISLSSPLVTIPEMQLQMGKEIALLSPAPFTSRWREEAKGTLRCLNITWEAGAIVLMQPLVMDLVTTVKEIELSEPLAGTLQIEPTRIPLDSLKTFSYRGTFVAPRVALKDQPVLENTSLSFRVDSKQKVFQISSQLGTGGLLGDLSFLTGSSQFNAKVEAQNLSTSLLEPFIKKKGLKTVVGPEFNGTLVVDSSPKMQQGSFKWTSSLLSAQGGFVLDENSLQLQGKEAGIVWTLTPEGYAALDPSSPFSLKEASTLQIELSRLVLPASPQITWDLGQLQLQANAVAGSLIFSDKRSTEGIELKDTRFRVESNPLQLSLSTAVMQGTKRGSLSLKAAASELSNLSQLSCDVELALQQFPTRALDVLARAQGRNDSPFTALFGGTIDMTGRLNLKEFTGPISLSIQSQLTRASMKGKFASGALLLDEPIHAQMQITPEVSRLVLKEVNPLNISQFYSKDPVTVEIPATGFYLPIYPKNLQKMALPSSRIELGQIYCQSEGNLKTALSILKSKQSGRELMVWFAPLDFSVRQGVASVERTEILLADTYDIAIWGNFDLSKNYVDMLLGLPGETLYKAFGVKNLPENYVLTIPMRGPADNVEVDTGSATSKITLLLAWQHANKATGIGKTPGGAIIGGLIQTFATLPDSDAKVPPAKRPFPWEVRRSKTSDEPRHKGRHFKQNDKPWKQILKVVK